MPWDNLGDFLGQLHDRGELARIPAAVDPDLELAEIVSRVCSRPGGGPGLLFETVTGSRFPAVANIFGSAQRMALALGVDDLDELTPLMGSILHRLDRETAPSTRTVTDPPCREHCDATPDLTALPLLRGWPGDGGAAAGRYLTLPLVVTADAETGETNCGIYRVEALGPDRAVIGWHPGSGGERHWQQYRQAGRRMPVAIALGGPPELIFCASVALPGLPDEFRFAGMLRGAPVDVAHCLTSDLVIPAAAEVVIEGYVEPSDTAEEGPFGNHTGFYAPARQAPLFRVTAITRRRNPVIPVTVVGPPPQEDCWLAKAGERLMLAWLTRRFPWVVDLSFPLETIFHRTAVVSVDTTRRSDVPALIRQLRLEGPLRRARVIVAVDSDTGVDQAHAWWRAVNCCNWRQDLTISDDGTHLDVDATRKETQGPPLERQATAALVDRRWQEYGLGTL